MNFLDSYFRTGDKMRSKAARQEFYCAVVEYYYKGAEPSFKTEQAEIGWEGVRWSLEKARAGRLGGLACANGGDRPTADGQANPEANPQADGEADGQADPQAEGEEAAGEAADETRTKEEEEEEEGKPYGLDSPCSPPFALLCLGALNDELGTAYTRLPDRCGRMIADAEGRFTVEEVRGMVRRKCREWRGTSQGKFLTPNYLFGPNNFERLMFEGAAGKGASRYAKYA